MKNLSQKEQYWLEILNEGLSSGMQITDYCKEKKIGTASFYQWRNRLLPDYPKRNIHRNKKAADNKNLFVPIKLETSEIKRTTPVEHITLHYPNGCYLRLSEHFDPEVLKSLIK